MAIPPIKPSVTAYVREPLIKDNDTLRKFLPNAFDTAEGETALLDKLDSFLYSAETWVYATFINLKDYHNIFDNIQVDPPPAKNALFHCIVDQALMTAIPSLDLVLTPNGFGVISNANIAPASKERVERLLDAIEKDRDRNIQLMLLHLTEYDAWKTSAQAKFFAATLFPDLSLCDYLGITEHKWEEYLKWRAHLITVEHRLANEYISPELYDAFRTEALLQFANSATDRRFLIQTLRFHEIAILQGRTPHPQALADIVNIIRSNPDTYPEWQNTATAALFSPNKFENTKGSGGYWF